jgi:hypothetical protein
MEKIKARDPIEWTSQRKGRTQTRRSPDENKFMLEDDESAWSIIMNYIWTSLSSSSPWTI